MIYEKLRNKEATMAVVGLGYVGLPIALEFARDIKVLGFDINAERVELMKKGIDPSNELDSSEFDGCDIEFTANPDDLKKANFFVVAVPTPINSSNQPDLGPVLSASKTVGNALKKGDYVIYESTVYPGCTEDDCVPVLEKLSGLKMGDDFKVGYSPERINPGDKQHTIRTIVKVVAGNDAEALEEVAKTYEMVIDAGVHKAANIKTAEASKVIENTQRDVNISLINELSIILNRVGINTYDVLECARTKWNFLNFTPGLVGGHCIGVDPYYLTHKAKKLGYHARVINSGRYVNDSMGPYVGKQTVKRILEQGKNILDARVLVIGMTFKENVSDIRNSKVIDVIRELDSFSVNVDVIDPWADPAEVKHEYDVDLIPEAKQGAYDAVIVAVNHKQYDNMNEADFKALMNDDQGVLVDLKGLYRHNIKDLNYWSL
ncbi:MAG: nucleotide sugar dehydrogenase [Flavobacteriales bacterium]|nr:nucleotide sugar dehydrogenase [Flavobacteriales bacterium]MDG1779378.1 nucleotide sugar dehydrogenase [Flavobacteriales bacterium]